MVECIGHLSRSQAKFSERGSMPSCELPETPILLWEIISEVAEMVKVSEVGHTKGVEVF
jgi:hypothetical protein